MNFLKNNRGFTLIELLLVIGIVAIILAVIVPMGIRANIDAKYGVVRQNCSELASFASKWAEKSAMAQDEQVSTATIKNYFLTLANGQVDEGGDVTTVDGQWVATQDDNNWNLKGGTKDQRVTITVPGRFMDGAEATPEDTVEDLVPPDRVIRNPFTEVSIFRNPNDPDTQGRAISGAVACGAAEEATGGWLYFGLAFQGSDSTEADLSTEENAQDGLFHAGMGISDIGRLRNAVFMGRYR